MTEKNAKDSPATTAIEYILAPKHILLTDAEAQQEVLQHYNISRKQMPVISVKDPAVRHLVVKGGDIIKIIRNSPVTGKAVFYRVVVE